MVWKKIKSIQWYEVASKNPEGVFMIEIRFDAEGIQGILCRNWLRLWVPQLVNICSAFLKGSIGKKKTIQVASSIKKGVEELQ